MASWEILGKLGLDIKDFEKSLEKAKHECKEFSKEAKEIIGDIAKESGAGDLTKLLGFGGLTASITAFGAGLVEAVKGGLESFSNLETSFTRFEIMVKDPQMAANIMIWSDEIGKFGGNVKEVESGFRSLLEAGVAVKDTKEIMEELNKIALATGDSVADLAEAFRKVKAGGLDAGEGANKLLKQVPGLAPEIDKLKNAQADGMNNWWNHDKQAEADKIRNMSAADWVKGGNLDSNTLQQLLKNMTSGKGMYADADKKIGDTFQGHLNQLSVAFEKLQAAMGLDLGERLKKPIEEITKAIENATPLMLKFGESLGNLVDRIESMAKSGGQIVNSVDKATGGHAGSVAGGLLQASGGILGPALEPVLTAMTQKLDSLIQETKHGNDQQAKIFGQ